MALLHNKHMRPVLLLIVVLGTLPLVAASIDVTNLPSVAFNADSELYVDFGVWTYGHNNQGVSPYPTTVGLLIASNELANSALVTIPGTSIQYYSGYVLHGWLQSLNGSVSIPLYDPDAALLGLPPGSLLLTPGTVTAGGNSIDAAVISASVSMPLAASEALFGSNIGSYNGAARFEVLNLGQSFSVGLGPDYTMRNAIWEPGIQGLGAVETSGITGDVTSACPEPATFLPIACGLALLFLVHGRERLRRVWLERAPSVSAISRTIGRLESRTGLRR